ncbi:imelysin family protein [Ensifer soli]|uniref:imelysin family protein n=1 Tax=Ciceribacter sp. sgz301302 TaxID=3342379 RepID=UPI0035B7BC7F
MRRSLLALAITLLAVNGVAAQEGAVPSGTLQEAAVPGVLARVVDAVIRPGYRSFHAAADDLERTTAALCEAPSAASLDAAKSAFAAAVSRWSEIEIVRDGPAIAQNRFERLLFYPDRKGTGLKQVQAAIANRDETATAPASLRGKSVAMQGLGALEFVLYGSGAEALLGEKRGYRCRYGAAIAGNIAAIAGELAAEWDAPDGVGKAWKAPGPGNPLFRSDAEAVTAVLGIMVHGAETVRDQRILPFYRGTKAGTPDKGRPKSALYWRSGLTVASLHGNIAGLRRLWETADMARLVEPGFQSVAGSVDFLLKALDRSLAEAPLPVEAMLADAAERQRLDFVLLTSRDLIARLNRDYGGAIGLGAGFSFADGD